MRREEIYLYWKDRKLSNVEYAEFCIDILSLVENHFEGILEYRVFTTEPVPLIIRPQDLTSSIEKLSEFVLSPESCNYEVIRSGQRFLYYFCLGFGTTWEVLSTEGLFFNLNLSAGTYGSNNPLLNSIIISEISDKLVDISNLKNLWNSLIEKSNPDFATISNIELIDRIERKIPLSNPLFILGWLSYINLESTLEAKTFENIENYIFDDSSGLKFILQDDYIGDTTDSVINLLIEAQKLLMKNGLIKNQ